MRNKLISTFMILTLLLCTLPISVFAADPNIDGGGGGMGGGTSENSWTPGMDGVRVTIVNAQTGAPVTTPIDYTNKNPSSGIIHFGKKSKAHYRNGTGLSPVVGGYSCIKPSQALPTVVSSNGSSNIAAIRSYFTDEQVIRGIALNVGMNYNTLVNGNYKLLLEPIAYFKFEGNQVGMTAHEAAMYDQQLGGGLRSKMASLSHQNLPLAMFLERSDLGFPAFSGDATGRKDNATIIASLGLGIVRFNEIVTPEPAATDVEYRVNTEVITAVTLFATSEINPDSPATVTFNIRGTGYRMTNVVIPEGESQVVFVKWTTPPTEQTVTISISTNKGYLNYNSITASIVDLGKNPPPDPKANDRNDSFSAPSLPSKPQKTSASWSVWYAVWYPYWVWCDHDDWGHWVDEGWYNFYTNNYTASLTSTSTITPDSKVPTASGNTMKSGYGVNNKVRATFSSSAPTTHVAGAQTAISYFPEFRYNTYWRLLDLTVRGFSSQLEFKQNNYSTYTQRSHFSPVWYPNGTYKVYTYLIDAWTPAGMLSMNLNDSVTIQGSVFDDWHIGPKS